MKLFKNIMKILFISTPPEGGNGPAGGDKKPQFSAELETTIAAFVKANSGKATEAPPIVKAAQRGDLVKALKAAQEGLSLALRSLIASGVPDGNEDRNNLESAFENAKNAAADPQHGHLVQAEKGLKTASHLLANRTLKNPADLNAVREAHAATTSAVNRLKPKES